MEIMHRAHEGGKMLPPRMSQIKSFLEQKPLRAREEEEFLEELRLIDNLVGENDIGHADRLFSGPSEICPCCGK